jgi:L-threonine kinase
MISNQPITHDQAAEIALSIEPTDSSLFPDLSLFAYRSGKFSHPLEQVPPFQVLIVDPGGKINTIEYNSQDHSNKLEIMAERHHSIFHQFQTGIAQKDWEIIGSACTKSAVIHQELLPNPYLDQCLQIAESCGALGICRAHSGTIIGLLFKENFDDLNQAKSLLKKHLPDHITYRLHRCISGGPRYDLYKENQ